MHTSPQNSPAPFLPAELIQEVDALKLRPAFDLVLRDEQTAYANWLRAHGGDAQPDRWAPLSPEQLLQRTRARGAQLSAARAA